MLGYLGRAEDPNYPAPHLCPPGVECGPARPVTSYTRQLCQPYTQPPHCQVSALWPEQCGGSETG